MNQRSDVPPTTTGTVHT